VSPSAAALYSAVIDLRPESRETDRSWFREPGQPWGDGMAMGDGAAFDINDVVG
jgi:hypothetical protein